MSVKGAVFFLFLVENVERVGILVRNSILIDLYGFCLAEINVQFDHNAIKIYHRTPYKSLSFFRNPILIYARLHPG